MAVLLLSVHKGQDNHALADNCDEFVEAWNQLIAIQIRETIEELGAGTGFGRRHFDSLKWNLGKFELWHSRRKDTQGQLNSGAEI